MKIFFKLLISIIATPVISYKFITFNRGIKIVFIIILVLMEKGKFLQITYRLIYSYNNTFFKSK